ncbi:MAG: DUF1295 domain-containing protein [Elainellaceae cyanobacterium]
MIRVKHAINLHKVMSGLVILGLMVAYDSFGPTAWIIFSLHGMYGMLWLMKDQIYPDKQWEQEISPVTGIVLFIVLMAYWVAPWIVTSQHIDAPIPLMAGAIAIYILGTFLHYGSDAQKYFMLKYRSGLITEGFFARCRNPNYLGEALIYGSFVLLSMHWLAALIWLGFIATIFVPNMLKKDKSLSRYPEFDAYKARSGLFFPKLFPASTHNQAEPSQI